MARVQGTVVLQAIIGKDGAVQDLKVLSGRATSFPLPSAFRAAIPR
jgi:outer membrane biosynthesis protein TonB